MKTPTMDVSIIIPVYNDPEGLRTTLRSLINQNSDNYEVIIADNGSNDKTKCVIKEYTTHDKVQSVIEDEIQGSYAARNTGIEAAMGDIISFIDSDMWVDKDYVGMIRHSMHQKDVDYMGCAVEIVASEKNWITRYNRATGFQIKSYIQEQNYAPTCCLVVKSELFDAIGKFDQRLVSSGDVEFGNRVADAGYKMSYEPDITLYHPARASIIDMISKHVRIGRGKEQLDHFYPNRYQQRPIANIRNFLPPRPTEVDEGFKINPSSTQERVYWYIFAWILKLGRNYGRIYEHLHRI